MQWYELSIHHLQYFKSNIFSSGESSKITQIQRFYICNTIINWLIKSWWGIHADWAFIDPGNGLHLFSTKPLTAGLSSTGSLGTNNSETRIKIQQCWFEKNEFRLILIDYWGLPHQKQASRSRINNYITQNTVGCFPHDKDKTVVSRLIFIMGLPVPEKDGFLYIETGDKVLHSHDQTCLPCHGGHSPKYVLPVLLPVPLAASSFRPHCACAANLLVLEILQLIQSANLKTQVDSISRKLQNCFAFPLQRNPDFTRFRPPGKCLDIAW